MANSVDLLIFPKVQEGNNLDDVKAKLVKALRVEASTVERWFSIDSPSKILRGVDEPVARRYEKAIKRCGANCNVNPSGDATASVDAGSTTKNKNLYKCPSCQYEEEIPQGDEMAQCPKCGLDMGEWAEQEAKESEKGKILQHLQEAAKSREQGGEDTEAKMRELERLRSQEQLIMAELDLKPQRALWLFFEKYPVTLSLVIISLVVVITVLAVQYVEEYLDQTEKPTVVDVAPTDDVKQIAEALGVALQLKQVGGKGMAADLALVTQVIRGQNSSEKASVVEAAKQMMNGGNPKQFTDIAIRMLHSASAQTDTIGGVSGLTGTQNFGDQMLAVISPSAFRSGHEQLLRILAELRRKPDPGNPGGPDIYVEAIEEMDGSAIVDLLNSLAQDLEWDQFLSFQASRYLGEQNYKRASALTGLIQNPVVKIESLSKTIESQLRDGNLEAVGLAISKVFQEFEKIEDADVKTRTLLAVGETLATSGSDSERAKLLSRIEVLATKGSNHYERTVMHGWLAVAYMQQRNQDKVRSHFAQAIRTAGQIKKPVERISAFIRLAQRYFDVRNLTLASEILSEAEVLAVTKLEPESRDRVFAEIAMARGYMGDFVGASMAIENAGRGEGKQQLLSKLAEMLIDNGRYFQAMDVMDSIVSNVEYARLGLRVVSSVVHSGRGSDGEQLLVMVTKRAQKISDPGSRSLMLSQLARLWVRVGDSVRSDALFKNALVNADGLQVKRAQVTRGLVALNRARVFQFARSADIMESVSDTVVKDPISNEIFATQRTVRLLLSDLVTEK